MFEEVACFILLHMFLQRACSQVVVSSNILFIFQLKEHKENQNSVMILQN